MNIVRRLRVNQIRSWTASFRLYSSKDKDKSKSDSKSDTKSEPKKEAAPQSRDKDKNKAPAQNKTATKAQDKAVPKAPAQVKAAPKAPAQAKAAPKAQDKVPTKAQDKTQNKAMNKAPDKAKDNDKGNKDNDVNAKCFPKDIQKVTLIKGEGVGPELMAAIQQVFSVAKVPIEWDTYDEWTAPDSEDVSPAILESLRQNRVGIKGPVDSRKWQRQIRKQFIQYAYVTVCKNIEGLETPYGKFDLVIIRDQMEGDYSGIEHRVVPGVMQTIKVCTTTGADRLARFVFIYALENKRKKITVAHKANIMRMTDGNFLESMQKQADQYQDMVQFEDRYLDTVCLNMLMKPDQSDVLVSSSMYGDVVRILGGNMMGGPGLSPGFSVSSLGTVFDCRMKSQHDIADKDLVNPTGTLLAGVLLLRHIKQDKYADSIECAVRGVYRDTDIRTEDVGGSSTCSEFVEAVCERLQGD